MAINDANFFLKDIPADNSEGQLLDLGNNFAVFVVVRYSITKQFL